MTAQTIGLFEAKAHLSELVARAEQGVEVVITRHNRPVARLVPVQPVAAADRRKRKKAVEELLALRAEFRQRGQAMSKDEIVQTIRGMRDEHTVRKLQAAGVKP